MVDLNKEKPGKGNFVITVVKTDGKDGGEEEPVVNLLGMKRPFPALKALDMEEVISKVLAKIEDLSKEEPKEESKEDSKEEPKEDSKEEPKEE